MVSTPAISLLDAVREMNLVAACVRMLECNRTHSRTGRFRGSFGPARSPRLSEPQMQNLSRRQFLQGTAAAGASLLITGTRASGKIKGANDRLRIAVAGLNGRGNCPHQGLAGTGQCRDRGSDRSGPQRARQAFDFGRGAIGRQIAAQGVRRRSQGARRSDLDAISVATPNHWHSLITIWAAQAGKHVYVEKPMSHDVVEGRVAVEAQKKYGVVVQHGTQSRSNASIAGLHDDHPGRQIRQTEDLLRLLLQAARFDRHQSRYVPPARARLDAVEGSGPHRALQPELRALQLALVLEDGQRRHEQPGDAPARHRPLGLGPRSDGPDPRHGDRRPLQVERSGRNAQHDVRHRRVPQRPARLLQRAERELQGYQHQVENEYYFEDGGKIVPDRKEMHYFPAGSTKGTRSSVPPGKVTPGGNWAAFIAACRAGNPGMANGNAVDAHYGSLMGHLMNNSYRLGTKVPFNAKAGRFGDDKDGPRALHEAARHHARRRRRSRGQGGIRRRPLAHASIPRPNATSASTPPKPTPCSRTPTTPASRSRAQHV